MKIRPRRSVLFMPGSNARALEKARTLPADAVVFDLEDAVAPEAKADARRQVSETLIRGGYAPREVIVRVNDLNTSWGADDLAALAPLEFDGILLPKVDSAEQVRAAVDVLDSSGGSRHALWIMIETPAGVLRASEIAAASKRLTCIVMGTSDLSKDMRVPTENERLGLATPLSWCVTVARAFGLDILDGVQLDLRNEAAYREVCLQGRRLGFDGKTLIHPSQITTANEIFAPAAEDVNTAREILDAWDRARSEGQGITVVRGRLVETLHVEEAQRTLALMEAIRELGEAS
ncbi:MAG: CoA ester lyase [Gammaproteobacteria bacterium]|nr:CoA ester lyase [Gammaproteobacteria bacterium]MDH3413101.1 CoA ester lyase [Gammaproteobacteria bacterium]